MKLECNLWYFNFYIKTYEFVKRIKEKSLYVQHIFFNITALFEFLVPVFCLGIEEVSIDYYKISTFGSDFFLRACGCVMCVLVLPLKYQLLMIFLHIIELC